MKQRLKAARCGSSLPLRFPRGPWLRSFTATLCIRSHRVMFNSIAAGAGEAEEDPEVLRESCFRQHGQDHQGT